MTEKVKNMLKGAGSVMNLSPGHSYKKYIPEANTAKRMEGHWSRVGKNLQSAINRFSNEQKTKK